jgi:hypothetical protein
MAAAAPTEAGRLGGALSLRRKCSLAVLKLSRRRNAEQGERANAASQETCDPLFHGAPRFGDD